MAIIEDGDSKNDAIDDVAKLNGMSRRPRWMKDVWISSGNVNIFNVDRSCNNIAEL